MAEIPLPGRWQNVDNRSARSHQKIIDAVNRLATTIPGPRLRLRGTPGGQALDAVGQSDYIDIRFGVIVAEGPDAEADFTKNMYWVRLGEIETDIPLNEPMIVNAENEDPVLETGSGQTAEPLIVAVTNLDEAEAESHGLPVDGSRPVAAFATTDANGDVRWWMQAGGERATVVAFLTNKDSSGRFAWFEAERLSTGVWQYKTNGLSGTNGPTGVNFAYDLPGHVTWVAFSPTKKPVVLVRQPYLDTNGEYQPAWAILNENRSVLVRLSSAATGKGWYNGSICYTHAEAGGTTDLGTSSSNLNAPFGSPAVDCIVGNLGEMSQATHWLSTDLVTLTGVGLSNWSFPGHIYHINSDGKPVVLINVIKQH